MQRSYDGLAVELVTEALAFRAISSDDIEQLANAVADAFLGYRAFAPDECQPPSADEEAQRLGQWIGERGFWGELAGEGSRYAGHAMFIPAACHAFRPAREVSAAHLLHLFVPPVFWGEGVAARLLGHATAAAAARGFTSMRLFVAAGHARARRFYTREGFVAVGEPFDFGFGLPTLEYQHALKR